MQKSRPFLKSLAHFAPRFLFSDSRTCHFVTLRLICDTRTEAGLGLVLCHSQV